MDRFASGDGDSGGDKRASFEDGRESEAVRGHALTDHAEVKEERTFGEARSDESLKHRVVGRVGMDWGVGEEQKGNMEVADRGGGGEGEEAIEGGLVSSGSDDGDLGEELFELGHREAVEVGKPVVEETSSMSGEESGRHRRPHMQLADA